MDDCITIGKHGQGSYWDHLPKLTDKERIRQLATHRFVTQNARYKIKKFSLKNRPSSAPSTVGSTGRKNSLSKRKEMYDDVCSRMNDMKGCDKSIEKRNDPSESVDETTEDLAEHESSSREGRWTIEYKRRVTQINISPPAAEFESTDSNNHCGDASKKNTEKKTNLKSPNTSNKHGKGQQNFRLLHKFDCLDHTAHLPPPPKFVTPKKYPCSAYRNKVCCVCTMPADGDSLLQRCILCPAVAHAHCTNDKYEQQQSFTCEECSYEVNKSKDMVTKHVETEKETAQFNFHAAKVCAMWKSKAKANREKKVQISVVRLQSIVRTFFIHKKLYEERRQVQRPIKIEIICGINLPVADWDNKKADPYIILTVLDQHEKQIWRFDGQPIYCTLNPEFHQEYIIPGCSGTAKIVVTCVDRDTLRDQLMGQCFLPLSNKSNQYEVWDRGGHFRLALDELRYMPKTTSGNEVAMDLGAVDFGSIKPQGEIELRVHSMDRLKNVCGFLITSTPLDEKSVSSSQERRGVNQIQSIRSKKYWCVLADNILSMFKKFGASKASLIINLDSCDVDFSVSKERNQMKLSINNDQMKIDLCCLKAKDRDRWITAFELCLGKRVGKK
mmetsp:Transcript_34044/g.49957  ORF Transcript_34044/g.49957 Transcript_34044/m.49957 type:complete len:612 (+) Transcript_34044:864-2699(+)